MNTITTQQYLSIDPSKFMFQQREINKKTGAPIPNKCGRDFLFYVLHFYYPAVILQLYLTEKRGGPQALESRSRLGGKLPHWLAWTGLQFVNMPRYLRSLGLNLYINNRSIVSFPSFMVAMLHSRPVSFDTALECTTSSLHNGEAVGIDLVRGLYDHIMFVGGYDKENLYICDTHRVPGLGYVHVGDGMPSESYFMRFPFKEIESRWNTRCRLWRVTKSSRALA